MTRIANDDATFRPSASWRPFNLATHCQPFYYWSGFLTHCLCANPLNYSSVYQASRVKGKVKRISPVYIPICYILRFRSSIGEKPEMMVTLVAHRYVSACTYAHTVVLLNASKRNSRIIFQSNGFCNYIEFSRTIALTSNKKASRKLQCQQCQPGPDSNFSYSIPVHLF
jgi:hypothetical protein